MHKYVNKQKSTQTYIMQVCFNLFFRLLNIRLGMGTHGWKRQLTSLPTQTSLHQNPIQTTGINNVSYSTTRLLKQLPTQYEQHPEDGNYRRQTLRAQRHARG